LKELRLFCLSKATSPLSSEMSNQPPATLCPFLDYQGVSFRNPYLAFRNDLKSSSFDRSKALGAKAPGEVFGLDFEAECFCRRDPKYGLWRQPSPAIAKHIEVGGFSKGMTYCSSEEGPNRIQNVIGSHFAKSRRWQALRNRVASYLRC
jgi:hypothetical protein